MNIEYLSSLDWLMVVLPGVLYFISRILSYKANKLYNTSKKHQLVEGMEKAIELFEKKSLMSYVILWLTMSVFIIIASASVFMLANSLYNYYYGAILFASLYDWYVNSKAVSELKALAHSNYFEGQMRVMSPMPGYFKMSDALRFTFLLLVVCIVHPIPLLMGGVFSLVPVILGGYFDYLSKVKIKKKF